MNQYWKRFSIVLNASLDSVALIKGRIMWNVDLCWCQNISQQQQMSNVRWNGLHILHFTIMSVHANISHLPSQLNHVFQFASLKGSSFIFSVLIYQLFNSLWQMYLKEVHKFFYSTLKIKVCVCLVLRVSDLMLRLRLMWKVNISLRREINVLWIFEIFRNLRQNTVREPWDEGVVSWLAIFIVASMVFSCFAHRASSILLAYQYLYEIYTFNSVERICSLFHSKDHWQIFFCPK